jgi:hypothetical protein
MASFVGSFYLLAVGNIKDEPNIGFVAPPFPLLTFEKEGPDQSGICAYLSSASEPSPTYKQGKRSLCVLLSQTCTPLPRVLGFKLSRLNTAWPPAEGRANYTYRWILSEILAVPQPSSYACHSPALPSLAKEYSFSIQFRSRFASLYFPSVVQ